jgi:hypothetical protein
MICKPAATVGIEARAWCKPTAVEVKQQTALVVSRSGTGSWESAASLISAQNT